MRNFYLAVLAVFCFASLNAQVSRTPWQIHDAGYTATEQSTAMSLSYHGDVSMYQYANIPVVNDPLWASAPLNGSGNIQFNQASRLFNGQCYNHVDFTYFQTIVSIPVNITVTNCTIAFDAADDGVRAYVFNAAHPTGAYVPGSEITQYQTSATTNIASLLAAGDNRIVLVQGDDCPVGNTLTNARISINGQTVNNISATALNFDGGDDRVIANNISLANKSFTVEFLARRAGSNNHDIAIGAGSGVQSVNQALHIGFRDNNNFTFAFYGNDLDVAGLSDNQWHHWACVYKAGVPSGNNRFIYRDGVLVASDRSANNFAGAATLLIGEGPYFGNAFGGDIDEVRIWGRALCQSEIANSLSCELSPAGQNSLLALYHLNQGLVNADNSAISSVIDASGGNNNGTMFNFAKTGTTSNWVTGTATGTCSAFIPPTATISAGGSTTFCQGGSVTLTANAGISYLWSTGATTQSIIATQAGNYSVTVTNASGCAGTSAATTVSYITGTDTDGDGIPDTCDADDDNDGIPDAVECNKSNFFWSNPPTESGNTATGVINGIGYTYTSSQTVLTTPSVFNHGIFPVSYNVPNIKCIQNIYASNNTLTFASPISNPVLVFSSIGAGNVTVPIEFSNPVQVLWSTSVVQNTPTRITGNEGYAIVRLNGIYSSISFQYLANENYVNFLFGADFQTCGDTDGDAIPDYLDTDSDGDGCTDAIEGDQHPLASQIVNGRLTGGVDAKGIPLIVNGGQGLGTSQTANANCNCQVGIDRNAPVPNLATLPLVTGECSASVTAPTATDACMGTITGTTTDPTSYSGQGTFLVHWTYSDGNGNTTTQNQTVVIDDNTPPVITCPFNITVSADANQCGAIVNYNQPSATDNCGNGVLPTSIPGYTYKGIFGGHAYFLSNSATTPENAHAQAIATGGHLVTINSAAENTFVANFNSSTRIWIGYTDRITEGTYKWITNEPVTYTNWASGEPNNAGDEDWAVINWTGVGTWNDWTFGSSALYAIEFEGGSIPTTLVSGPPSGSFFPIGTTSVTYSANDARNTVNCSFTVTVVDNQNPTITAPANVSVFMDPGSCFATNVNLGTPVFSDNCPGATVSNNAPSQFAPGITGVLWTVTDAAGHTATALQNVLVSDNQNPTITCPAPVTRTADPNTCGASITVSQPTFSDNCGVVEMTWVMTGATTGSSPSTGINFVSPRLYNIGTTTITYTVRDKPGIGNSATCSQTITVTDNQPPVLTTASNQNVNLNGSCSITIPDVRGNATDNCSGVTITQSPAIGATLPAGHNQQFNVTVTATDGANNSTVKTVILTAKDVTPPTVVSQNVTVQLDANGNASIVSGQTYSDVFFENFNQEPNGLATSLSNWNFTQAGMTVDVGDYILNNNAKEIDLAGNNNARIISKKAFYLVPGQYKLTFDNRLNNNPAGGNSVQVVMGSLVNQTFASQLTATTESVTFTVVAPTTVNLDFEQLGTNDAAGSFISNIRLSRAINPSYSVFVSATDCGGIDGISVSKSTFDCSNLGANNVLLSVKDVNGNETQQNVIVTVQDNTAPVLTPAANQNVNLNGSCSVTIPDVRGTATDNCSVTITQSPAAGTLVSSSHNGTIAVTVTATDAAGNTNVKVVILTAKDITPPTVTCPPNISVNNNANACGAVVTYPLPVATDNCSGGAFNYFNANEPNNSGSEDHLQLYNSGTWNDLNGGNSMLYIIEVNSIYTNAITNYFRIGEFGGHTYYRSNFGANWNTARSNAIALGIGADLASINTLGESSFLAPYGGSTWVGGYQDHSDPDYAEPGNASQNWGGWKWVDGTKLGAGQIAINRTAGFASGTLFPVGTTTVTHTATDQGGNVSSCSFTVTVTDNQKPVITHNGNKSVFALPGLCSANPIVSASATDNCSVGAPTGVRSDGQALNAPYPVGTTTITWNVTDVNGNTAIAVTQSVTVSDTQKPILVGVPADVTVECTAVPAAANVTATDNCPNAGAVQYAEVKTNGSCAGNYTLTRTWTVTDAHNNTTSATQVITVQDTKAPVLTAPADITVSNDPGQCGAKVSYAGTAADDCSNAHITYSHQAGSFFAKGTTTVTVTATDDCGNASSAAFTVTVNDTENPVINGENTNITVNFNAGSGAPASYTEAGITFLSLYGSTAHVHLGDNNNDGSPDILNHSGCCSTPYRLTVGAGVQFTLVSMEVKAVSSPGTFYVYPSGASVTVSSPGLYTFPAGFANVTEVRWQQDGGDMTIDNVIVSTKTQGVCPANIVKPNDPGQCGANVSFSATATDNCSATVTFSQAPGSFFPVGTTPVTVTATDPSGNTSSCTFTVTVNDTEKPKLSGVPSNATVECTAVPAAAVVTATDNCPNVGVVQYNQVKTNGNCGGNYTLTRTWTVTDAHNNTTSASQVITVRDTQAPVLTMPADASVTNDAGQCGAKVTFSASATDACSNATVTYSRQPGSFFPVGTTVVTVTARDDCGNTTSATFNVTVSDTEAPKLVGVPADATVECTAVPAAASVTATDNCPNVGAVQYAEVKTNGSCAGNYTLTRTWTVTDAHNNTTSATQVITVQDTKAPVLTAPADITVSNDPGQCGAKVSYAGTAADDCSNAHITYSHQPGSFFAKGTTTVTVTATDDCGNASSATFTVTVNDTENPVITCVSNQTRNTDPGQCSYATVGSEFDPSFGDNCPGSTVTNNYNNSSSLAGAIFQKGTTTVTWTVTDASGNTAICSSSVTVEDHENPTIVCVSNQSKVVDNAGCSYLVKGSEFDATFADNCPGSTVTNNYNNSSSLAGVSFPKGTTTVTWTVTDASGNTASCSYNVTVTTSLATFITSSNVLPQGTQPNTIYVGYTPAQTLTLTANPSGGGGTYTYNWSVSSNLVIVGSNTGSTVQVTTTTPGSSSAYQVNLVVTDQFGCFVSAQTWTVQVKDVRCGNKNDKVLVCQKTSSTTNPWVQICIAPAAVATHLGNGSTLGTCPTITSRGTTPEPVVRAAAIKAYPNPSTGVFELQLQNYNQGKVEIQVIDNYGKLVAKQSLVVSASVENVTMDIRRHASGVYQVRVVSEDGVKTLKVVVAK
jgi:hypothetical protein